MISWAFCKLDSFFVKLLNSLMTIIKAEDLSELLKL